MASFAKVAPAFAVEQTANRKTGPISVTHASQASCPPSCAFYGRGCYAETGIQAMHTRRLNRSPEKRPDVVARHEAAAVEQLSGKRMLRVGIVGDKRTDGAARIIAAAAVRHTAKHGQPVYAYTHAWRAVDRSSWGAVSVLASCESVEDVRQAEARGYAAALVVDRYAQATAYQVDGYRVIPCPATTRDDVTCDQCRLCARDTWLRETRKVIAFEAHSAGQGKVRAALAERDGK